MSASYHQVRDRWWMRTGEWLLFSLVIGFRWLTWPVPTWTLAGLCAPIGSFLAAGIPSFRRRAEANLALVWPDRTAAERRRIIRAAGAHCFRIGVEYVRLDRIARKLTIHIEGGDHLAAARTAGRGAVLVSAHFGNWEAIRVAALRLGCEAGFIYRPQNNRYLDRFALRLLACAGRPVLQKGRQGMRQLVTHVSRGGFVMILVDQRNTGAPFIDFLGRPAETATGAAEVARRTGAALIPVRALRNVEARRFEVTFEAPVTGEDSRAMMAEVNRRIGAWIEAAPEQWFWFHRRWRTTIRSRRPVAREG
jgi:Kdo2-lipid IVA lauroyltransferase/acyltransferase